jgi:hypothetical protein
MNWGGPRPFAAAFPCRGLKWALRPALPEPIAGEKRIYRHLSWPRVMRVFQHEAVSSRGTGDRACRVNAYRVRAG